MSKVPTYTDPADLAHFSQFCAPHVLAGIMGVPRLEAAELLASIPGMAHPRKGYVVTFMWNRFLTRDLGGQRVLDSDLHRAHPDNNLTWREYQPRRPKAPTVAMFCRAFPTGTYVVGVRGHTLLVKDGEVIVDTRRTRSMRARVEDATKMPAQAEGLVPEEAEVMDRRVAAHRDLLAQRRERRAAARQSLEGRINWIIDNHHG